MTDEFSLLCAIADNPGETVPALAYADWLDEFDPTRSVLAEYIRDTIRSGPDFSSVRWVEVQNLCIIRGGTGFDCWSHCFAPQNWNRGLPFRAEDYLGTSHWFWTHTGPTIVRRAPVSKVTIRNKRPLLRAEFIKEEYRWFRSSSAPRGERFVESTLPDCIFQLLTDALIKSASIATYSSITLANDALSKACVAWARATDPNTLRESNHVRPSAPVPSGS